MTDVNGNFNDVIVLASGDWTATAQFPGDATRGPSSAVCGFTVP
jgi:hypothetical protein